MKELLNELESRVNFKGTMQDEDGNDIPLPPPAAKKQAGISVQFLSNIQLNDERRHQTREQRNLPR
jgi:hypothetical protein